MGYKRSQTEEEYAREELTPILSRLENPSEMVKFLAFANQEIGADPTKLAARMAHCVNGPRLPSSGVTLLLKKFEKLP